MNRSKNIVSLSYSQWRININFMVFNEDNEVNKVSLFVSFIFKKNDDLNQTIIMNNFKTRIIDKKDFSSIVDIDNSD